MKQLLLVLCLSVNLRAEAPTAPKTFQAHLAEIVLRGEVSRVAMSLLLNSNQFCPIGVILVKLPGPIGHPERLLLSSCATGEHRHGRLPIHQLEETCTSAIALGPALAAAVLFETRQTNNAIHTAGILEAEWSTGKDWKKWQYFYAVDRNGGVDFLGREIGDSPGDVRGMLEELTRSMQRTRASRFCLRQIKRHQRLALVADLDVR